MFPLENFVSEVVAVPGWLREVGRALSEVGHRSKGRGNTARSEHEKVWRYRSLASSQTPLHGWSDKQVCITG